MQFCQHGDKAGKLLVHQVWQLAASGEIAQIQTEQGNAEDPKEINCLFNSFTSRFTHQSEIPPHQIEILCLKTLTYIL